MTPKKFNQYQRACMLAEKELHARNYYRPGSTFETAHKQSKPVDIDALRAWDSTHSSLVVKYLNQFSDMGKKDERR